VIAPEHERHGPRIDDVADLAVHRTMVVRDPRRLDRGVARIHGVQHRQRLETRVERVHRAGVAVGEADRPRTEARTGSIRVAFVHGRAHDRDVRSTLAESLWLADERQLLKGRAADVHREVEVRRRVEWRVPVVLGREAGTRP